MKISFLATIACLQILWSWHALAGPVHGPGEKCDHTKLKDVKAYDEFQLSNDVKLKTNMRCDMELRNGEKLGIWGVKTCEIGGEVFKPSSGKESLKTVNKLTFYCNTFEPPSVRNDEDFPDRVMRYCDKQTGPGEYTRAPDMPETKDVHIQVTPDVKVTLSLKCETETRNSLRMQYYVKECKINEGAGFKPGDSQPTINGIVLKCRPTMTPTVGAWSPSIQS